MLLASLQEEFDYIITTMLDGNGTLNMVEVTLPCYPIRCRKHRIRMIELVSWSFKLGSSKSIIPTVSMY